MIVVMPVSVGGLFEPEGLDELSAVDVVNVATSKPDGPSNTLPLSSLFRAGSLYVILKACWLLI